MTYTIDDFTKEYFQIRKGCPSYRLGQHFINMFIVESSTDFMCKLWNEEITDLAQFMINDFIEENQWDYNDLPLLEK